MLWFASCESLSCHLEILNDGFEQRVPILYNDGGIEAMSLNAGAGRANSESLRSCMFPEPGKEQPVAVGFAPIAVVTHIEQNMKILGKKLVENSKNGLLDLRIVGRTQPIQFLNDKLECRTSSHRFLGFKRNQIVDAETGSKDEIAIRGIGDLVWRMGINSFERKVNHSVTAVP